SVRNKRKLIRTCERAGRRADKTDAERIFIKIFIKILMRMLTGYRKGLYGTATQKARALQGDASQKI
ncbi:MAG: hypothetical protein K2P42_07795, partial [Lachnospiraceae bacterium]|nr:hypothetical protein [Lachnospiraceae bacterium]